MSNAVLAGYYGVNNLGDELMLVCLQKWLVSQGHSVTVLAEDAVTVNQQHHFTAVQNYPLLGQWNVVGTWLRGGVTPVLKSLSTCDLFIAGGGDIIRDSHGLRTFSYQVEKLIVATLLGKPIYLVNVGITEPSTAYGKRVLSWLLPRCRKIIVRDHRSVEICKRFGAARVTEMLPDIVTYFGDLFPVEASHPKQPYIVVALHGNANVYGQYQLTPKRIMNLAAALDAIVEEHGVEIRFVACQSGEAADDHVPHAAILQAMRHRNKAVLHPWTVKPQPVAEVFQSSAMVLAMRLHAGILARSYGKPCVLFPYDAKVSELARQAAMPVLLPQTLNDLEATLQMIRKTFSSSASPPDRGGLAGWSALKLT